MESISNSYSIKDLEAHTGIKAHTIRIWEKRYGLLDPDRTDTNIRTYTEEELKKLLNVSLLNRNGKKISHIAALSREGLIKSVLGLNGKEGSWSNADIEKALVSGLHFNKAKLRKTIAGIVSGKSYEESYLGFLYPLTEKAKLLWQTGSISRAQADFIKNTIEEIVIEEDAGLAASHGNAIGTYLLVNLNPHDQFNNLRFLDHVLRKRSYETIFTGYPLALPEVLEIHKTKSFDFLLLNTGLQANPDELINYLSHLGKMLRLKKIFLINLEQKIDGQLPGNIVLCKSPSDFIHSIGRG